MMIHASSFAGPSDDEKMITYFLSCQKFYRERIELVYDYDVKRLDAVLKAAEREIAKKYSQDDALKLWVNATIQSQNINPKNGNYEKAFDACRTLTKASDERIKSRGFVLD
jgi:hypothetical protein